MSREFEEFLRRNGIKHKTTDPYHPASNGLAERAVQIFKKGIRKMQTGTLQVKIAQFLFSYQNTPQSTTDIAPAQLFMGRKLRSPLDLLKPDLQGQSGERARASETVSWSAFSSSLFPVRGTCFYAKFWSRFICQSVVARAYCEQFWAFILYSPITWWQNL